jgi:hypothetical protein
VRFYPEDIHLDPATARGLVSDWCDQYDVVPCGLRWEAGCDEEAYITWPDVDRFPIIYFTGWGTDLETLAHELAHLTEGPDEPTHGPDHNFLTELIAFQLVELLRDAGS